MTLILANNVAALNTQSNSAGLKRNAPIDPTIPAPAAQQTVPLVQADDGILKEVDSLRSKLRALVVSSNLKVNDANILAANQAQISQTVTSIATFAGKALFGIRKRHDGSTVLSVTTIVTTTTTTVTNTTASESTILDTESASEIADSTKRQTQLQAGPSALGNANQSIPLVAHLIKDG